ncbi:MAG: ThuA domain-containing protein [Bacteroidales bacterium]
MKKKYIILILTVLFAFASSCKKDTIKTLIITGQNTTNWEVSSPVLNRMMVESGLFSPKIMITPQKGGDMSKFNPDFSKYRLVVLDYNGDSWSDKTKSAFTQYVNDGGGVVIYHAADNAFPEWKEYNEMIGLGGGGGRNEKDGPYVYVSRRNELLSDSTAGPAGALSEKQIFEVRNLPGDNPITAGLPSKWLHADDIIFTKLRGPANNMEVLATVTAGRNANERYSRGMGKQEPVLMTITYGKGRIFHTVLGHVEGEDDQALKCTGFITTFLRGAEWAATGAVTQEVPYDFPNASVVVRDDLKPVSIDEAFANIGSYDISKSTRYLSVIQIFIRKAAGDPVKLLEYEKQMVNVLKDENATNESKNLLLRELSWMGSDYCIPAIKELENVQDLKDNAEFALKRLQ